MSLMPLGLLSQGGGAGGGAGFELISTTLISTNTASVTFSGIASSYKHLQLRITARGDSSYASISGYLRFNSDTANNYSFHNIQGYGSMGWDAVASQSRIQLGSFTDAASTTSAFGGVIADIFDYANTNKNKTVRGLGGISTSASSVVKLQSGAWYSTAAVTSITLTADSNFVSGSRFSLYGVQG